MAMKTMIPLYEGSDIHAELIIEEGKGYLKYFWKGFEIIEDTLFESFNRKVFDFFIFVARGICAQDYSYSIYGSMLWSY